MKILQSLKTLYESFIDKLFPTDIKCLLCGRDLPDNNFSVKSAKRKIFTTRVQDALNATQ